MSEAPAIESRKPPLWERAMEFLLRFLGLGLSALAFYLTAGYVAQNSLILIAHQDTLAISLSAIVSLAGVVWWYRREARMDTPHLDSLLRHTRCQLVVRYFLAYIFVLYGFAKLYRTQLYEPFLHWKDTPLGELNGFALTWAFFGHSYPYSVFIALSQILSAMLLCFRRTQLIGAVMLLPIIGNIVFVNFAYQVPVKLYSTVFLVMTGYLVLSDFRRLKVFFWNNGATPAREEPEIEPRVRKRHYVFKFVMILAIFAFNTYSFETMTNQAPYVEHPVYGVWEIESSEVNGEVQYQRVETRDVWTKVIFEALFGGNRAYVYIDGKKHSVNYTVNKDQSRVEITFPGNQEYEGGFKGTYELSGDDTLVLDGKIGENPTRLQFTRKKYK